MNQPYRFIIVESGTFADGLGTPSYSVLQLAADYGHTATYVPAAGHGVSVAALRRKDAELAVDALYAQVAEANERVSLSTQRADEARERQEAAQRNLAAELGNRTPLDPETGNPVLIDDKHPKISDLDAPWLARVVEAARFFGFTEGWLDLTNEDDEAWDIWTERRSLVAAKLYELSGLDLDMAPYDVDSTADRLAVWLGLRQPEPEVETVDLFKVVRGDGALLLGWTVDEGEAIDVARKEGGRVLRRNVTVTPESVEPLEDCDYTKERVL